jgi:hypothetical protein
MDEEDKGIKAIPFSGKKDDYTIWRARFLSYAQVKGCKTVLMGNAVIPNSTDVLVAGDDDAEIALRKANDRAYSMLTMSVKDPVSFGAVYNALNTA